MSSVVEFRSRDVAYQYWENIGVGLIGHGASSGAGSC